MYICNTCTNLTLKLIGVNVHSAQAWNCRKQEACQLYIYSFKSIHKLILTKIHSFTIMYGSLLIIHCVT